MTPTPSVRRRARRRARPCATSSPNRSRSSRRSEEEDSFSAILFDIVDEIGERLAGPRRDGAVRNVSDLIDGLDDLSSRLDRKP